MNPQAELEKLNITELVHLYVMAYRHRILVSVPLYAIMDQMIKRVGYEEPIRLLQGVEYEFKFDWLLD